MRKRVISRGLQGTMVFKDLKLEFENRQPVLSTSLSCAALFRLKHYTKLTRPLKTILVEWACPYDPHAHFTFNVWS